MRFIKLFGSGLNANSVDPRDKIFAEFHCSLCGKNSDIDVTRVRDTFDFVRERKCTHCKQIDVNDKAKSLQSNIERLTDKKNQIEIQIEKLIRELDECVNSSNKVL